MEIVSIGWNKRIIEGTFEDQFLVSQICSDSFALIIPRRLTHASSAILSLLVNRYKTKSRELLFFENKQLPELLFSSIPRVETRQGSN